MSRSHVDPPLRLLTVCSGIGAADLACARLGLRLVGAVERQAYAAGVLLARMEEEALDPAPVWCGDVHDLDARPLRGWVDVVAAGIPCVSWSTAGKRAGVEDERHLGAELVRIVRDVEPAYVIVENVPGFAVRDGLGSLLGELAGLGFDAEWDCFTAAQVGAPHIRERLWMVASHTDRARYKQKRSGGLFNKERPTRRNRANGRCNAPPDADRKGRCANRQGSPTGGGAFADREANWDHRHGGPPSSPVVRGVDDGSPASLVCAERLHALGNAWVPAQAEHAFRELLRRFQ